MSSPKQRNTRTRTRARATSRRGCNSSSPIPGKRRRLRHEPRDDTLFAIKDIIDEKFVGSKRFFRIDWADNPATGESFEPTWEPEENANQVAVEDWEWEKKRRALPGLNSEPSPTEEDVADNHSATPSSDSFSASVYVEVQSKSDFLKSRPDFATPEVIAISSSQLSQFPHPDSECTLPPSQFFVISSQASQNNTIADSQALSTGASGSQKTGTIIRTLGISQTTIPDSQDFSTDLSQDIVEVPSTADQFHKTDTNSTKGSHNTASAFSIPPRQPDSNLASFGTFSISIDPERNLDSQQNPPPPQSIPNISPLARPTSSGNISNGFLTQLEFEPGEFSLSVNSKQQSQLDEAIALSTEQQPATPVQDTSIFDSHQPAQRVPPFPGEVSQFLTQTEVEFFSASEEYNVVPDTV